MARKKRVYGGDAKLDMTPMIDVVFQLIIFFVVTMVQEDILSQLTAMAPAGDSESTSVEIKVVEIDIHPTGFRLMGTGITLEGLDSRLKMYSELDNQSSIVIRCTGNSKHGSLVQVLDLCYKYNLHNLAIFTV